MHYIITSILKLIYRPSVSKLNKKLLQLQKDIVQLILYYDVPDFYVKRAMQTREAVPLVISDDIILDIFDEFR